MTHGIDDESSEAPSFERLARRKDDAIDVTLGAALVALDVYPSLDVARLVRTVRELGAPLEAEPRSTSARTRVEAVSRLFRKLGFRGNELEYTDPRNSLLPDVVRLQLGIPITLSVIWWEMARSAGLAAWGVSFPGHFLVRVDDPEQARPIVVDPFAGGVVLDEAGAATLLRRALGDGAAIAPELFAPANPRAILLRILTNLKAAWMRRGENARAFVAVDRMLTLAPDTPRLLRERAAVASLLGASDLARADLARVVELEPDARDIAEIREARERLERAPRTKPS